MEKEDEDDAESGRNIAKQSFDRCVGLVPSNYRHDFSSRFPTTCPIPILNRSEQSLAIFQTKQTIIKTEF